MSTCAVSGESTSANAVAAVTQTSICVREQTIGEVCLVCGELAFWELAIELLSSKRIQNEETVEIEKIAKPEAFEMNPYSERFNPAKYLAYCRRPNRRPA